MAFLHYYIFFLSTLSHLFLTSAFRSSPPPPPQIQPPPPPPPQQQPPPPPPPQIQPPPPPPPQRKPPPPPPPQIQPTPPPPPPPKIQPPPPPPPQQQPPPPPPKIQPPPPPPPQRQPPPPPPKIQPPPPPPPQRQPPPPPPKIQPPPPPQRQHPPPPPKIQPPPPPKRQPPPPPQYTSLIVAIHQDIQTGLPVATLFQRTPPVGVHLLLDINGRFVAVNCDAGGKYRSTNYNAPLCNSAECSRVSGPNRVCGTCSSDPRPRPGCNNNTCAVSVSNPITHRSDLGELAEDSLILRVLSPVFQAFVQVPNFLFICAPRELFTPAAAGFPHEAVGVAGLGPFRESLPVQVATHFDLYIRFFVCLPRGTGNAGSVVIGKWPFNQAVLHSLVDTPLSVSPEREYFISLEQIRINNKIVNTQVNRAIISTTARFSILEHTMYAAVTRFFSNQIDPRVRRVGPVGPLGWCFDSRGPGRLSIPLIELVVDGVGGGGFQRWVISPANSVVEVRPGVVCLAFVDGGRWLRKGDMVIGAYQLEDNLVRLDLHRFVLGFSNSLLHQGTSCSDFIH